MSTRPTRDERLIRREIPAMTCRPGCSDCCGPVPWSPAELARVADAIPPQARVEQVRGVTVLLDPLNPLRCPFVSPAGGCAVYDRRPHMCRIFGTAPAEPRLRCPHGCRPERPLTPARAGELTARYRKAGGP
jgi:uncharacterized protein